MYMPEPFRLAESGMLIKPVPMNRSWETLTNEEARGFIWMFEAPLPGATYVIGCDPAQGIVDWDRHIPRDDTDNDNTAIEVFRVGKRTVLDIDPGTGKPKVKDGKELTKEVICDYQVAEYAAPVDYEYAAKVVNMLGRLYKGNSHMGAAHAIVEVYPGPGWMVEKELISKYGYLNFYQRRYINTIEPQSARGIGWEANNRTVRDLWIFGLRHVTNRSVVVRSPWLHAEMKTTDPIKFMEYRSEAQSGFHDDRLRASMLCWLAAHDISSQMRVQMESTTERTVKPVNWQQSDMSLSELKDAWQARFDEIANS